MVTSKLGGRASILYILTVYLDVTYSVMPTGFKKTQILTLEVNLKYAARHRAGFITWVAAIEN